jgi:excisionase family DNA binding protein
MDVEPLTYTVPQAAEALNVSADHLRHLIRRGTIRTVPGMGKRTLISRAWLAQWVLAASRTEAAS